MVQFRLDRTKYETFHLLVQNVLCEDMDCRKACLCFIVLLLPLLLLSAPTIGDQLLVSKLPLQGERDVRRIEEVRRNGR